MQHDLLIDIALAAIEVDYCDAVHDDPLERSTVTEALLTAARAELRKALDAHHDATPRA